MTSWVLVILASYGHGGGLTAIENLKSAKECDRVASVVISWRPGNVQSYKCIEVINK